MRIIHNNDKESGYISNYTKSNRRITIGGLFVVGIKGRLAGSNFDITGGSWCESKRRLLKKIKGIES